MPDGRRELIKRGYTLIYGPRAGQMVISRIDINESGDRAVIYVPKRYEFAIGRIIGKKGKNIKAKKEAIGELCPKAENVKFVEVKLLEE